MIESFLTGVIAAASLTAAVFFLKFWRDTRDSFFLAFAASFAIEAVNRATILFLPHPNEGNTRVYVIRLLSYLLILFAIIRKNLGRGEPR